MFDSILDILRPISQYCHTVNLCSGCALSGESIPFKPLTAPKTDLSLATCLGYALVNGRPPTQLLVFTHSIVPVLYLVHWLRTTPPSASASPSAPRGRWASRLLFSYCPAEYVNPIHHFLHGRYPCTASRMLNALILVPKPCFTHSFSGKHASTETWKQL
ncbi:hypothetical protein VTO73DRAFT_12154 [Trametes versicolor]